VLSRLVQAPDNGTNGPSGARACGTPNRGAAHLENGIADEIDVDQQSMSVTPVRAITSVIDPL
jgi:hypothetical protein